MNYVFVAPGIPDYFPKNIMTSPISALLRILLLIRIMNKGKNQFRIKALEAIFTRRSTGSDHLAHDGGRHDQHVLQEKAGRRISYKIDTKYYKKRDKCYSVVIFISLFGILYP